MDAKKLLADIVDDGSRDRLAEVLKTLADTRCEVVAVFHAVNQRKGAAPRLLVPSACLLTG